VSATGRPSAPLLTAGLPLWQDRDPLEALETAAIADELGYPQLWIGEMATFDAFALAAAVGDRTRNVELTVGPLAVEVRDPMAMAMGIASVAALTGRPARLAIGASSPVVVAEWHGRPWRRTADRMRETAEALGPLLAGERGSYDGELMHTAGYRLRLPPTSESITMAAFGDRAVAVAARYADRMVINLSTVEGARDARRRLDAAAGEAGRRPPTLALWVTAGVDGDERSLEQMRRALAGYLAAPGYGEMFAAAGHEELVAFARTGPHPRELVERLPDDLVSAVALTGDIGQVRERIAEYGGAGVDELVVLPATADDPGGRRTLEALAP
jgi:probable F420-dependent oxidoreductase